MNVPVYDTHQSTHVTHSLPQGWQHGANHSPLLTSAVWQKDSCDTHSRLRTIKKTEAETDWWWKKTNNEAVQPWLMRSSRTESEECSKCSRSGKKWIVLVFDLFCRPSHTLSYLFLTQYSFYSIRAGTKSPQSPLTKLKSGYQIWLLGHGSNHFQV